MKKIILFITIIFMSCSSNIKNNFNEPYCNEIRNNMIIMLKHQISNDSLYIVKTEEINQFIINHNYNINIADIENFANKEIESCELYDNKFDADTYQTLKLELLKEYYDINNDYELNEIINKFNKYNLMKDSINNVHRKFANKVKINK